MNYSRRGFGLMLPGLAASALTAQQEPLKTLPTQGRKFEDLPVKVNGQNKSHAALNGLTHTGFPLEVHITELAAGSMPHPAHHHINEEMFLVQAGLLDVTVNGTTYHLDPGSVCYVNSNEEHGARNPGPDRCEYFVVELGPKT